MVCLALSFGLPLLQVPQQFSFRKAKAVVEEPALEIPAVNKVVNAPQESTPVTTPTTTSPTVNNTRELKAPLITWQQALTWAGWLYWFGVIVFAINFLVQLINLLYRAYTRPVIRDGRYRIVELSGDQAPCSFWNNIFINPEKYDWETYNQILLHEKIHIEQRHSFDLLLAELVIVFQWFNPFAWQYRKALENNLEYLTDDQLVNHQEVERTTYQLSLLKVSAPHFPLNLTTNYNQSLLKKE
ncbi:M56 family metallopeptidase [Paraflavitalea speifideaquila]|uniref:M56 family metallopeptidase n=1 Tax=Paraflavitalea speifideaquila TaxID=3076558 RepID=UPI0028F034A0|nr:M56 family metallopeptidase [Paraflavitalea speifideiaquila]